jgi:DNA replication protein
LTNTDAYHAGMLAGLTMNTIQIPSLLLENYARIGLNEVEMMLVFHLIFFSVHDGIGFPTPEQLAKRMSVTSSQIFASIERLVRDQFIQIEAITEAETGKQGERYNLTPILHKFSGHSLDCAPSKQPTSETRGGRDLFSIFEREFARPLSSMEYEMIVNWLDQDRYPESLILTALKEAVFAGKVHFRYIDRILLEWNRNQIRTPEEAKIHTERYRG